MGAVRFGDWDKVASMDKLPPADFNEKWPFGYGMVRSFSLAIAGLRLQNRNLAEASLEDLRAWIPKVREVHGDDQQFANLTKIVNMTAEAAFAHAKGDLSAAVDAMKIATDIEMGMPYNEPPQWLLPSRECYGQALLDAGRFEDARKVFHATLYGYSYHAEPRCGWALIGYKQSLEALPATQERQEEISNVTSTIELVWRHSDVPLNAACSIFGPVKQMTFV